MAIPLLFPFSWCLIRYTKRVLKLVSQDHELHNNTTESKIIQSTSTNDLAREGTSLFVHVVFEKVAVQSTTKARLAGTLRDDEFKKTSQDWFEDAVYDTAILWFGKMAHYVVPVCFGFIMLMTSRAINNWMGK